MLEGGPKTDMVDTAPTLLKEIADSGPKKQIVDSGQEKGMAVKALTLSKEDGDDAPTSLESVKLQRGFVEGNTGNQKAKVQDSRKDQAPRSCLAGMLCGVKENKKAPLPPGYKAIPLLAEESRPAFLAFCPSINTITFFKGSAPTQKIRTRLASVIAANPWLCGRLVQDSSDKRVQLVYEENCSGGMVDYLFEEMRSGTDAGMLNVGTNIPYERMLSSIFSSRSIIEKGRALLNKDRLLFRVTLVRDRDRPDERFALIVSLSHVVGDGHTYYNLWNMLSEDAPIRALSVRRKDSFSQAYRNAIGHAEHHMCTAGLAHPLVVNHVSTLLFSGKPHVRIHYVDISKVEDAKAQASSNDSVPFVSTNDVLTSTLASMFKSCLCLMAINFRERLPDLSDSDAGNYEGGILLQPADYAQPELIRKTLRAGQATGIYRRAASDPPTPLPSFMQQLRARVSLVTNWASFAGDMVLDGCEVDLHLPCLNPQELTYAAVIFKPIPGKLAVLMMTRDSADLTSAIASTPLGDLVAPGMQH